jgi:hypothetical protein
LGEQRIRSITRYPDPGWEFPIVDFMSGFIDRIIEYGQLIP